MMQPEDERFTAKELGEAMRRIAKSSFMLGWGLRAGRGERKSAEAELDSAEGFWREFENELFKQFFPERFQ